MLMIPRPWPQVDSDCGCLRRAVPGWALQLRLLGVPLPVGPGPSGPSDSKQSASQYACYCESLRAPCAVRVGLGVAVLEIWCWVGPAKPGAPRIPDLDDPTPNGPPDSQREDQNGGPDMVGPPLGCRSDEPEIKAPTVATDQ